MCISIDGNYSFIGHANGSVDVFNLQSGQNRGTLPAAHTAAVTFVGQLATGGSVVTASLDGTVSVCDWPARTLRHTITVDSPVARAVMDADSALLAVACDDFTVRVIDVHTHATVRRFPAHGGRVTALAFSHDSRWLHTGCLDGTVRVFDMPSGRMIDWWRCAAPPVALAVSPDGSLLCSAHAGVAGLYLWTNRSQYDDVVLRAPADVPPLMTLPTVAGPTVSTDSMDASNTATSDGRGTKRAYENAGLIELAGLPRTRWAALANLEIIRVRGCCGCVGVWLC